MGSFHLAAMSLKNLFKGPATKGYPATPIRFTSRSKGHVVNDIETCILCGICQKKCPTGAIQVNRGEGTWCIEPFSCIQCLTCVRQCPKHSLTMDPNYTPPAAVKSSVLMQKPVAEASAEASTETSE